MAKIIKLKCTANAHVDGKVVLAGTVREYDKDLASRLLISNRFEVTEDATKEPASPAEEPDTVRELKAALDEIGVEYPSKATKAELESLYEDSID